MSTALRTLVLGLVAALLLLQPAARAGAGCGETMLTGSCDCTEPAADGAESAGGCCGSADAGSPDESSPDDEAGPAVAAESGCQCSASPLPDLPGAPRGQDREASTLGERVTQATQCALEQRGGAIAAPELAPPRTPPRARPANHLSRGSTARTLAFLGTCLR